LTLSLYSVICAPGYHENNVVLLTKAIDNFCASDASVVLCGDFNLPHIDWSSPSNYVSSTVSISSSLIDCIQGNALVQCVEDATRKNKILDLVFPNDHFLIQDVIVDVPFSTNQH